MTSRRRSRPGLVSAADRASPLNGSRSPPGRRIVTPGVAGGWRATGLLRPPSRSFLTEEIGRGLLNINQQLRRPRATTTAHVGDDFTLRRRRSGLKSEILATRRAACETTLGVNHRLAFSYVFLLQHQLRQQGSCIDPRRLAVIYFSRTYASLAYLSNDKFISAIIATLHTAPCTPTDVDWLSSLI